MKHYVEPKVLRQREREAVHRLDVFLKHNAPRFIAREECFRLMCRLVGEQNWKPNLKTVLWFAWAYVRHWYGDFSWRLWLFSLKKVHRKSETEIDAIMGIDDGEEEEWLNEIEVL